MAETQKMELMGAAEPACAVTVRMHLLLLHMALLLGLAHQRSYVSAKVASSHAVVLFKSFIS